MPSHTLSRRVFVQSTTLVMIGSNLTRGGVGDASPTPQGASATGSTWRSPKALVFDVFGTVVDWRSSVTAEVQRLAKRQGIHRRRGEVRRRVARDVRPSMNRVRTGELPWTKLDALHRMALDRLLVDFSITGLSEAEKDALNRAWHRLTPWPDAVAGLTRLKKKFIIAPLSNGNISLMTDMAKHAGLPWDCILGAELVRHYKPDPRGVPVRRGHPGPHAGRRDDGGGAPGRPARVEECGTADGVRPAAAGVWAEAESRT